MTELEITEHNLTRRDFLRVASVFIAGVVLLKGGHASAQDPTPPVESTGRIQDGFLGNTPLELITYQQSDVVIQQRVVRYVAYGENPIYAEHRKTTVDVIINPEGVTFYHFRRMEEKNNFGLTSREDDDIFVAIVEPSINKIPVFLRKVFFGFAILGSKREFYTGNWNKSRVVDDLPIELRGIAEIEEALNSGKLVLYCNFGSRNRNEVANTIVGGIVSSDSLN
jgi:hypothetical protein